MEGRRLRSWKEDEDKGKKRDYGRGNRRIDEKWWIKNR